MLAKVEAWNAPTQDHAPSKLFMREQLIEELKFLRGEEREVRRLSGPEYRAECADSLRRDIETAERCQREEEARVAAANRWVSALRASLPGPGDK